MLIFFLVALAASVAGAICGIGGGVIIKPVLDLLHLETVTTISFLSGCTVLSMSCYSVGKSLLAKERSVSLDVGTPLALGAAAGGLAGNQLFAAVRELSGSPDTVGAVQAACLAVVTAGTLLYTINKARIPTRRVQNFAACVVIGLALGAMSSFLGIGGGPINLVVLYYFFSMDTKVRLVYHPVQPDMQSACHAVRWHGPTLPLARAGADGDGGHRRRNHRAEAESQDGESIGGAAVYWADGAYHLH